MSVVYSIGRLQGWLSSGEMGSPVGFAMGAFAEWCRRMQRIVRRSLGLAETRREGWMAVPLERVGNKWADIHLCRAVVAFGLAAA